MHVWVLWYHNKNKLVIVAHTYLVITVHDYPPLLILCSELGGIDSHYKELTYTTFFELAWEDRHIFAQVCSYRLELVT